MTIAITLKVNDGLVLAADSASTLIAKDGGKTFAVNVYNNANKIYNLRKGLPIGCMTWGAGSIGKASISTLAKDLRKLLSDPQKEEWWINPASYEIQDVARKVVRFMHQDNFVPAFIDWPDKPPIGFLVAGYSSGEAMAEEYQIDIDSKGNCSEPRPLRNKDECGLTWNGEPEAITRLILGFGTNLPAILKAKLGVTDEQLGPALEIIRNNLTAPLIHDAMPIQDAIDLAEFLVDVTVQFSKFSPGAPTVGGPIELAAVSKHEGFKWIKRKHYYSQEFNNQ